MTEWALLAAGAMVGFHLGVLFALAAQRWAERFVEWVFRRLRVK